MDKDQNENLKQTESMLKEKTNQDYNKQKPNPNDPNRENENNEADMEEAKDKVKGMSSESSKKHIDLNSGDEGNEDRAEVSEDQIDVTESGDENSNSMQRESRSEDESNLKSTF